MAQPNIRHAINSNRIDAGHAAACALARTAPKRCSPHSGAVAGDGVLRRQLPLARDWFGASREQVHWLMVVHEGEWLGSTLEPVVVLLNAIGLLWMLITGAGLLIERWRRKVHS